MIKGRCFTHLALSVLIIGCIFAKMGKAQTVAPASPATATSSTSASNTSNPTAQVNVQSVSGGGSSNSLPATPMAPGMPSFAGGPCLGPSSVFSASLPGLSFGRGNNVEDGSCQRRNWVQTLIGVAQHVSPQDRLFYDKLAFQVMREDPYLQGAFQRLGVPPISDANQAKTADVTSRVKPKIQIVRSVPSKTCVVVIPIDAPALITSILAKRGCRVSTIAYDGNK